MDPMKGYLLNEEEINESHLMWSEERLFTLSARIFFNPKERFLPLKNIYERGEQIDETRLMKEADRLSTLLAGTTDSILIANDELLKQRIEADAELTKQLNEKKQRDRENDSIGRDGN
jgi:hypothetical protein